MYASEWKLQLVSPTGEIVCYKSWHGVGSTTPAQSWALGSVYRYLVNEYIADRLCMGDYPLLHGVGILLREDTWGLHDYRITWEGERPDDPHSFLGSADTFILWKKYRGEYLEVFKDSLPEDFNFLDTERQWRILEDLGEIPSFEMPGTVLMN